jgi:hypothetical protein
MAVMAERGYPTPDFQQQLSNLSVVHGRTLHHYRKARQISGRTARDEASTEDLRQAMVHYRVLFESSSTTPTRTTRNQPPLPVTTIRHCTATLERADA